MAEELEDNFTAGSGGDGGAKIPSGSVPSGSISERSVSDDETNPTADAEPTNKRRGFKRPIDESLLSEDDARRLEARRAYNRQCAAKARKRSKDLISQLQSQVEDLTKDKAKLERSNEVMKAQLQLLEQQNRILIANQRLQGGAPQAAVGGPTTGIIAGAGLSGLQPTNILMQAPGPAGAGLSNSSIAILESLAAQGRIAVPLSSAPTAQTTTTNLSAAAALARQSGSGKSGLDSKIYLG